MLIKIDADKLQQVVEKYHLKLLVYYGSYARQEDFDPSRSDIDIAFISEQQLNSQQLFDLMSDLILLHRKSNIDLVNLQTASGLLKEAVANDGRVLYEKEEGYFQELCPYLYKCYYETRKFRQVKHALFEKKLAEELKNVRPR
ncbi:type VII toxin-antitoxin system MntA family adenylyltransferase antitoxin [Syntrophomonas wolfei]|jgi:predicted nucleotidyltransferase|uniref:type VII toxin-antitoxin system MntA family adenylyltransferase antitoxin n=1 Tax=Syntrophomonas wolfei TaxID=863 RepID=UPI000774D415|nr:nucleotidyltransferase domain-containing protein [Syntrophomonas wolfei]